MLISDTNYGSSSSRFARGRQWENLCREILNAKLGLGLEPTSSSQDIREKKDWRYVTKAGEERFWQFKWRDKGQDILVDVFEPYNGLHDPETQPGRDMVGNVSHYVVWPPDYGTIFVFNAGHLKEIVNALVEKWERRGLWSPFRYEGPLPYTIPPKDPKLAKDFELRITTEKGEGRRNGVTKVLAFLPTHQILNVPVQVPPQFRPSGFPG